MAFWTDVNGKLRSKTLGHTDRVSRRQAKVLRDRLVVDLDLKPQRPVRSPKLIEFVRRYLDSRTDIAGSTRREHETTCRYLCAFFGDDMRIDRITRMMAADWRSALARGELAHVQRSKSRPVSSEATLCKHTRNAKVMFKTAADQELVLFNPFDRLRGKAAPPDKDWHYLPLADLRTLLAMCPNVGWHAFLGLCRLAGLRMGEALRVRWQDIDWDRQRLTVWNPEQRRSTKKRTRVVPICRELYELLSAAFEAANPGEELAVSLDMVNRGGCRGMFERIIARAGLTPWRQLFQTLRKNRETDWAQNYPQHAVSTWMGHDMQVSSEYYLQIPDELYQKVAQEGVSALETGNIRETSPEPINEFDVSPYPAKHPQQDSNLQPSAPEADALFAQG